MCKYGIHKQTDAYKEFALVIGERNRIHRINKQYKYKNTASHTQHIEMYVGILKNMLVIKESPMKHIHASYVVSVV